MHKQDFRFETEEPSHTSMACSDEVSLLTNHTLLQDATCTPGLIALTLTWTQTPLAISQKQFTGPINGPLSSIQPNSPGPPHTPDLALLIHANHPEKSNPVLDHTDPITQTQTHNLIFTLDTSPSTSTPTSADPNLSHSPLSENLIPSSQSSHNPKPKKRLRKEFGRIGQHLRQRLFCGFFRCEEVEARHNWKTDSILAVEDRLTQLEVQMVLDKLYLQLGSGKLTQISFPKHHEGPLLEL